MSAFSLPISLCMIVKNEEAFLDAALRSAKSILGVDDIVVVDTGSTDRTKEIAHAHGAQIHDFIWCDDFSAARNFSAGHAEFDWIFFLDADEEVTECNRAKLISFIKDARNVGVGSRIELTNLDTNPVSRLYNRNKYELRGTIHEQIEPLGSFTKKLVDIPVTLIHYGYLPEVSKAKGTHERNARMLKEALEKQPNDPYLLFKLGNAYIYKDEATACEYLEKALEYVTDYRLLYVYEAVELYGYALINTGQYKKALALRDRYVKHFGNNPQFRFL
ncbi:MAG: glycosyltransferase, partial [Alphaproteobacteria bacterium]|nr:glycosyltransferase [Alphaproteobacteria bacterium]